MAEASHALKKTIKELLFFKPLSALALCMTVTLSLSNMIWGNLLC